MHKHLRLAAASVALSTGLLGQQFVEVTDAAGVGFTPESWVITNTPMQNWMAASVSAADYDGDGWDDMIAFAGDKNPVKLFRNEGDGTFSERAAQANLLALGPHSQALWGDPDDDGDLDVLLLSHGDVLEAAAAGGPGSGSGIPLSSMTLLSDPDSHKLGPGSYKTPFFQNQGDGTFVEISESIGLGSAGRTGALYGDLDGDLDLDLVTFSWAGDRTNFFQNRGAGLFQERTPANVNAEKIRGFSGHAVDYDEDGDVDILQTCDFGDSVIWRNEGGWTFSKHDHGQLGIGTDENGMGSAVGDYDHDGDFDWFIASIYSDVELNDPTEESGNRLYENLGNGSFADVTDAADVREGGWGWGSMFADLDNDGNADIVHTNGWMAEKFLDDLLRVFHNQGDGTFVEKGSASGLYDPGQGRGLTAFDYDQDGLIDIAVNNRDTGLGLWRNETPAAGNWLDIGLVGTTSNSFGIGAIVKVRKGAGDTSGTMLHAQHGLVEAGSNYQSQSPPRVWFGVAQLDMLRVDVEWPAGRVESFDIAANQRIDLVEGTGL